LKIFGIGLAKTGTTSVSAALNILGIPSLHNYTFFHQRSAAEIVDLLPVSPFDRYDAFFDWPHPLGIFEKVAAAIPDSRFILTTREEEEWLQSCLIHVLHTRVTRQEGWAHIDTVTLEREHELLIVRALEWGKWNPGRLLVFDVKEGWGPLCKFLGKHVPEMPFPSENSGIGRLEEILAHYQAKQNNNVRGPK
jgi:Sulfotransferase domain